MTAQIATAATARNGIRTQRYSFTADLLPESAGRYDDLDPKEDRCSRASAIPERQRRQLLLPIMCRSAKPRRTTAIAQMNGTIADRTGISSPSAVTANQPLLRCSWSFHLSYEVRHHEHEHQ